MSSLLEAALAYAEKGYPVFPCGAAANPKAPLTAKGFHDATTDLAQIVDWWTKWPDASIGIPTGGVYGTVLDIDPRSGGDESYSHLVECFGLEWTDTPTNITGSGGKHLRFKANPDVVGCTTALLPGIDIKDSGGYVIVPPSKPKGFKAYKTKIEDVEPQDQPKWLVEMRQGRAKETKADPRGTDKAIPEDLIEPIVDQVSRYWVNGLRNELNLAVSGYLYKKGVPANQIEATMMAIYKATGDEEVDNRMANVQRTIRLIDEQQPTLGASFIRKKAPALLVALDDLVSDNTPEKEAENGGEVTTNSDAVSPDLSCSKQSTSNENTNSSDNTPINRVRVTPVSNTPCHPDGMGIPGLVTWNELRSKQYAESQWVIEDIIPRNSVVLVWGKQSIGKTPLTWHMAMAVGEGKPFFDYPTVKGNVLFMELDMPEMITNQRVKEMPEADNVHFWHHGPISTPFSPKMRTTLEALNAHVNPTLVIIDSLRKCHSSKDTDSETPSAVYGAYMQVFPNASIVFIHHERKITNEDNRPDDESFSGSKAWINDAQVGIHLVELGKLDPKFPLHMVIKKNQAGQKDWRVRFKLTDGKDLATDAGEWEKIKKLMEQYSGNELHNKVAEVIRCSVRTAIRKVKELKDKETPHEA